MIALFQQRYRNEGVCMMMMTTGDSFIMVRRYNRRMINGVASLFVVFVVVVGFSSQALALFAWGNSACITTGFSDTSSGFVPINSIARSHSHTTSATGGVYDDGLLIQQVPGVGACKYTLYAALSSFTVGSDGSGTSTVRWSAVATNPAGCGPSFTAVSDLIVQSGGGVAIGTDPGGTFVSKCNNQ
jgi:hypothetical protein